MDAVVSLLVQRYLMAPLAVSRRLSPAHSTDGPDGEIETEGALTMSILMVLLVACAVEVQEALDVAIHMTVLPVASEELMKDGLLVPALFPLTCHW